MSLNVISMRVTTLICAAISYAAAVITAPLSRSISARAVLAPCTVPQYKCSLSMAGTVYTLLLEEGRIYVSHTDRSVAKRLSEHKTGFGSAWTNLYKPVKVIDEISNADAYAENAQVLRMMQQYGIEMVRGGSCSRYFGQFFFGTQFALLLQYAQYYTLTNCNLLVLALIYP
jgi:predicted GIY-YIG superfamily endonuclease